MAFFASIALISAKKTEMPTPQAWDVHTTIRRGRAGHSKILATDLARVAFQLTSNLCGLPFAQHRDLLVEFDNPLRVPFTQHVIIRKFLHLRLCELPLIF